MHKDLEQIKRAIELVDERLYPEHKVFRVQVENEGTNDEYLEFNEEIRIRNIGKYYEVVQIKTYPGNYNPVIGMVEPPDTEEIMISCGLRPSQAANEAVQTYLNDWVENIIGEIFSQ